MLIEQLRNLLILVILLCIGVAVNMVWKSNDSILTVFKCPSEYKTPEEYLKSLAELVKTERGKNPKITQNELLMLRSKQLEEHNCGISPWVLEDTADTEKYFNEKAQEFMKAKKYQDLITFSKEYIADNPNSFMAWGYQAFAYYLMGDCVEASASAYHLDVLASEDNSEEGKMAREVLPAVLNGDVCKER